MVTMWSAAAPGGAEDHDDPAGIREADTAEDGFRRRGPGSGAGPQGLGAPVTEPDRAEEWDQFVADHIAFVWSCAMAEGLARADAVDVCAVVWRNAALRLEVIADAGDPRRYLAAEVDREARRLVRSHALGVRPGSAIGSAVAPHAQTAGLASTAGVADERLPQ